MSISLTICGYLWALFPLSNTHCDLNQFPSVALIHNSLALMVFVTRTLPQKVKPEENLGSGTKEITQEKKKGTH